MLQFSIKASDLKFKDWNIDVNLETYCRIVCTRQIARTDPFLYREDGIIHCMVVNHRGIH